MYNQKNDILRIIGAKCDKVFTGPQNIFLDITNICNFSCVSCWIHSPVIKNQPTPKYLNFKILKKVLKEAKNWGVQSINISGDGEPFFHPDIKKIIDYTIENNLYLNITTNLSFNKELVPYACKVNNLFVHIDATTNSLYKKIHCSRTKSYYNRVFENLRYISEVSIKIGKPEICFIHIIHRLNYKYIRKTLNLLKKFKISKISMKPMESIEETKRFLLSETQNNELKCLLKKIILEDAKGEIRAKTNIFENYQALKNYKNSPYNLKHCFSGWFNLLIDFKGDVALCCHNDKTIVGNIYYKSLRKIWNSPRAKKMRLKLKYDFNLDNSIFKSQCRQCWWTNSNIKILKIINQLPI